MKLSVVSNWKTLVLTTPGSQANLRRRNLVLQVLALVLVWPFFPVLFLAGAATVLEDLATRTQTERGLFDGLQAPATNHGNLALKNSHGERLTFQDNVAWFVSRHCLIGSNSGRVSEWAMKPENID